MNQTGRHLTARTIQRWRVGALLAGALGLVALIALLAVHPTGFFQGYLVGFAFWIGVSLGCLSILMLHHLVAGEWGFLTQRILEAGASTVLVMSAFFIPVLFGMQEIYEWAHDSAGGDLLQHKRAYLNPTWFTVRGVCYFAVWIALAHLLPRWSRLSDESEDVRHARRMRRLSAGGLLAHILLMTFVSVDWLMSIEPHWYSSIYGWMLVASHGLSAIALTILALAAFRSAPLIDRAVRTKHFHDYGNLLLTFVILWAYLMFAQYLIIWSGNIPEDVAWYVHRQEGGWSLVAPFLIVFHFAVPFAILLVRRAKERRDVLCGIAAAVFFLHMLFTAWLLLPGFPAEDWTAYATAVVALIGIGGCWATLFLGRLAGRPLLPRYDPRFEDFLSRIRGAAR